jgi:exonuclease VII small subunit
MSSTASAAFSEYDEATQRHIIDLGCFIYDKSLEHYRERHATSDVLPTGTPATSWAKEYEYNQLKQQVENLSTRVFETREEEYKKGEAKVAEYKQQLAAERQRLDKILSTIQTDADRQIAAKTDHLNKKITELEVKNKWYYSLYEDKSKGKNYEEELYPKLLDYNDQHLNSIWQITHVGSVLSEKTDFHFRHKDLGVVILLDTKNNLPTNPVVSTAEFERDILRKETNAAGGIMLANGNISCKKKFEINKVQQKIMVYVSSFERNNIAYVFTLLDMIMEMSRGGGGGEDASSGTTPTTSAAITAFRTLLVSDYKREQSNLENAERLRKTAQKAIDAIIADFDTHFPGEDIEMAAKSDEVAASSARVKPKTSTEIIDYDAIEKDRTVVGQRSKYYLEYGTTIQYFKNNYARNIKMKSLEEQQPTPEPAVVISVNTITVAKPASKKGTSSR